MIPASEAREMLVEARMKVFDKAVKYEVKQGKNLCFVGIRANPEEEYKLEKLGYKVKTDDRGNTWLYR